MALFLVSPIHILSQEIKPKTPSKKAPTKATTQNDSIVWFFTVNIGLNTTTTIKESKIKAVNLISKIHNSITFF